ncbi:hypothetical protein SISSUDRAFT_361526 [Sistotremastrum suecicum HHB10207 ss-3]|uniref:Uncharacterized protein n=1 Tax=Sistotremastrum suecicum HHB10207 ss-3 TaxID=1314776 RepID=A0A165Z627_9AGAM|nr:hypothetical protein SISSUDRAFT_361526 [Sistotremastrum suecicum HHB10207 ss-3]
MLSNMLPSPRNILSNTSLSTRHLSFLIVCVCFICCLGQFFAISFHPLPRLLSLSFTMERAIGYGLSFSRIWGRTLLSLEYVKMNLGFVYASITLIDVPDIGSCSCRVLCFRPFFFLLLSSSLFPHFLHFLHTCTTSSSSFS